MGAKLHYLNPGELPVGKGSYVLVGGPTSGRYYRVVVSFGPPPTRDYITVRRLIESPEAAIALAMNEATEREIDSIFVEHTAMPKAPKPPKSKKLPRKLPDDPTARGVAIMREATGDRKAPKKGNQTIRLQIKRYARLTKARFTQDLSAASFRALRPVSIKAFHREV